jgi:cytochrome b pre-mRNA-processing protein 3
LRSARVCRNPKAQNWQTSKPLAAYPATYPAFWAALETVATTSINPMILKRFRANPDNRSIRELYGAIVAQARSTGFYTDYGVPDTVLGRFDLIVLHLVLLLARFDRNDASSRGVGQKLFDLFCSDLDANLREMGVGDLAVPKRMRDFGEAFYGRQTAYIAALAAPEGPALEKALARNIFHGVEGDGARRLARYARALSRVIEAQDEATLLRGFLAFPKPEAIPHV